MDEQLVIPGLDHSLYEVDGLFLWKQTPGFVTPKTRKQNNAKTKDKYWRNPEQRKRQLPIWEGVA
jgi:hypothetical protein